MKKQLKIISVIVTIAFAAEQIAFAAPESALRPTASAISKTASFRKRNRMDTFYPFMVQPKFTGVSSNATTTSTKVFDCLLESVSPEAKLKIAFSENGRAGAIGRVRAMRMAANLRLTINDLAAQPALDGKAISRISRFRIVSIEGPDYTKDGIPYTRPGVDISMRNDGTFEITIMGQLLDDSGLTAQQTRQNREVRDLLLRSALDRVDLKIVPEQIVFHDCLYVCALPAERQRDLFSGLRALYGKYNPGESPYVELLSRAPDIMNVEADMGLLPKDVQAQIRWLAAGDTSYCKIGQRALARIASEAKKQKREISENKKGNPVFSYKSDREFSLIVKTTETGLLNLGFLKEGTLSLNFPHLKPNTFYKAVVSNKEHVSGTTVEVFELSNNDYMPTSCMPTRRFIVDGRGIHGMSAWRPTSLVGDYIGVQQRQTMQRKSEPAEAKPCLPEFILARPAKIRGTVDLGSYSIGEETINVEINSKKLVGKDIVRLEFDTNNSWGLTIEAYDIDEKTGEKINPTQPLACLYYDFNEHKFVSFDKGHSAIRSVGREATLAAICGARTPIGKWAEPIPFTARCTTEQKVILWPFSSITAWLSGKNADEDEPESDNGTPKPQRCVLATSILFKVGTAYHEQAHYERRYGWILESYGWDETENRKTALAPIAMHRLVAKTKEGKTIGPLVNAEWVRATMGAKALKELGNYVDISDAIESGYLIGFEGFNTGKQSILDLWNGSKRELMPWSCQILGERIYIGTIEINGARVDRSINELSLPKGSYIYFIPVYSEKRKSWMLLGFDITGIKDFSEAALVSVRCVNVQQKNTSDILVSSREKRSLVRHALRKAEGYGLLEKAKENYCYTGFLDIGEVLTSAGFINREKAISDRTRKDYEKLAHDFKFDLEAYLLVTLQKAIRSINGNLKEEKRIEIVNSSGDIMYTIEARPGNLALDLFLAVREWESLQACANQSNSKRAKRVMAAAGKFVKPHIERFRLELEARRTKSQPLSNGMFETADSLILSILNNGHASETAAAYERLDGVLELIVMTLPDAEAEFFITSKLAMVRAHTTDGRRLKKLLRQYRQDDEPPVRDVVDFMSEKKRPIFIPDGPRYRESRKAQERAFIPDEIELDTVAIETEEPTAAALAVLERELAGRSAIRRKNLQIDCAA